MSMAAYFGTLSKTIHKKNLDKEYFLKFLKNLEISYYLRIILNLIFKFLIVIYILF
jgi:hypothetical protein